MNSNVISSKLLEYSRSPAVTLAFILRNTEKTSNPSVLLNRLKDERQKYEEMNNVKMLITQSFRNDTDPIETPKCKGKGSRKMPSTTPRPSLDEYYQRHNVDIKDKWCIELSDDIMQEMISTYRFVEFLSFRRNLLSMEGGYEILCSVCERLRSDDVRKLWEIESNEKASNGENNVRVNVARKNHKEKRVEEFKMRQLLKDKGKYYADVEKNTLDYFQVIEVLAPYLSKLSLKEVNHDMATQINESLNRSMTSMASKDRVYNSSLSLECRQAVVVLKKNCGLGNYVKLLCEEMKLFFHEGLSWAMQMNECKSKRKRELQETSAFKSNRSLKKRISRSTLTKKEIKDDKKGLSYKGDGGALQALNKDSLPTICMWKGCNGTDHKTRRSAKCKYNGWTLESVEAEVSRLQSLDTGSRQD
jgi:hypothetical protein